MPRWDISGEDSTAPTTQPPARRPAEFSAHQLEEHERRMALGLRAANAALDIAGEISQLHRRATNGVPVSAEDLRRLYSLAGVTLASIQDQAIDLIAQENDMAAAVGGRDVPSTHPLRTPLPPLT